MALVRADAPSDLAFPIFGIGFTAWWEFKTVVEWQRGREHYLVQASGAAGGVGDVRADLLNWVRSASRRCPRSLRSSPRLPTVPIAGALLALTVEKHVDRPPKLCPGSRLGGSMTP
jgi:hypothetical protein